MERYNIPKANSLDSMEGVFVEKKENTEDLKEQAYKKGYADAENSMRHDYSKDLNSMDILMDRFERYITEESEKIGDSIDNLMRLSDQITDKNLKNRIELVIDNLSKVKKGYGAPALNLQALSRYNVMRWKLDNTGSLYEEPAFVAEKLRSGTKSDLIRSINLLVWQRSSKFLDDSSLENYADIGGGDINIFQYEAAYKSDEIVAKIRAIFKHIFTELELKKPIESEFFPRPLLKCFYPDNDDTYRIVTSAEEQVIWPVKNGEIIQPDTYGFFPCFIEILRTAYRCAYLRTLEKTLNFSDKNNLPDKSVLQEFIEIRPAFNFREDQPDSLQGYEMEVVFAAPFLNEDGKDTRKIGDTVEHPIFNELLESKSKISKAVSRWQIKSPKIKTITEGNVFVSISIVYS